MLFLRLLAAALALAGLKGVGIILVDQRGRFLLNRRSDDPDERLRGRWVILAGGIEPGETPEGAALREIREETGHPVPRVHLVVRASWPRPIHLFAAGAMVPEAVAASRALREHGLFASVFVVTSPDLLYRGLRRPRPYLEELVAPEEEGIPVVSALDGHSHTLAFIGSALGVPQIPLGVDDFGQSGTRADLYRHYGIDADAIAEAARLLLGA